MWWILLLGILSVSFAVQYWKGPNAALGTGVLLSFLFPTWLNETFFGVKFDLRVASSLCLFISVIADSRKQIRWKMSVADWGVFALYCVNVASDFWHDGIKFDPIAIAFGNWSIPYIAGRVAIQSVDDWRWLTKVAVIVATVLSLWSCTEAVTRFNPGNAVFGKRPADRTNPLQIRVGVKRAEGPMWHPIWFGMTQLVLFSWTITAAYRGLQGDGPSWWCASPWCVICGILGVVSRGAALAAAGVLYVTLVFWWPRARIGLVAVGFVLAGVGYAAKDHVLNVLNVWAGDTAARGQWKVELDGRKHQVTSMSHRWLVFIAYRQAISETGLLGFGSSRTESFPFNVPLGPDATRTLQAFWSIDCEYLLLLLRFGWLGVGAFLLICLASAAQIARQAAFVAARDQLFPYVVSATILMVTLVMLVEWMSQDYGFPFLWLCGIANGPRLAPATADFSPRRERRHRSRRQEPQPRGGDPSPPAKA